MVKIEGSPCKLEIDAGSSNSIISWHTLKTVAPNIKKHSLSHCSIRLRDYQDNSIPVLGKGLFQVESPHFTGKLPIIIIDGALPSLLGLDWFQSLGLSVSGIYSTLWWLQQADVFDSMLGKYVGSPISFNLDPMVTSVCLKPRWVPFALRPKVDKELDKLLAQGILEPIDH